MRVTNFLIYVTNFVICVTNFVTKNILQDRENFQADRKNLLWTTINYLLDACPSHISYIRERRGGLLYSRIIASVNRFSVYRPPTCKIKFRQGKIILFVAKLFLTARNYILNPILHSVITRNCFQIVIPRFVFPKEGKIKKRVSIC